MNWKKRGAPTFYFQRSRHWLAAMPLLTLAACVTQPRPLYHWGDYQPEVYSYFQGDGQSIEAQQIKLEANVQQALAKGQTLPPGFHAHLGLLYLKTGQADRARAAFQTEEAQFPESKPYMDFLLKKFDQKKKG